MFVSLSEADILEQTYLDKMDVYRPKKKKIDGETIFLKGKYGDKVLEKVPCSLSGNSGGKIEEDLTNKFTKSDYKIFARPEIEVKENDFIVLTVGDGEIIRVHTLLAGKSRLYPNSHVEIFANEDKKA